VGDIGSDDLDTSANGLVPMRSTDEAVKLVHKIMYTLTMTIRENLDVRAQIGLLCVLAVWLHEYPKGVTEFLSEGSNLSYVRRFG